jgi:UPF0755 protein
VKKLQLPLAAILATLIGIGLFAAWSLTSAYRGFEAETTVVIKHGTGTLALGRELAQAGVVRTAWQFWLAKAFQPGAKLQAGEYRFTAPASANEVFSRIVLGDIYYFELTVPEGSNMFDIAHLLETRGIMSAGAFLHAASDPSLIQVTIQDLSPDAKSLEGFLFPSTYRLSRSITPAQLCRLMTGEFRKEWTKLNSKHAKPNAIVTLASLVEKETGVAEERPLIASVFTNRLKQSMRLQCDPTTIYAALLEHRYRGKIYASDLANTNPYNTYQNDGLPPGPIANPGAESLAAALHPAAGNYLYFVAKPEGGSHNFSATLAQHGQAVAQYRNATKR